MGKKNLLMSVGSISMLAVPFSHSDASVKHPSTKPAPRPFELQILGINDLHGQLDVTRTINGRKVGRADYLAAYLKQKNLR
ncbi:hypothetical protein P4T90_13630 [Heyndrickxia acidicola]|uniref:Bifunctional metallophosphatase/5'-nucleotidase n=1 Tax=Heyndrickxia acidicola TaxID=209389 RepID=A0ABU6MHV5_9BACI|nr:hypothetical protein [Heyndrickxia acidicola]MED1204095.1 hypothetical protein [Heyndrickxia acidicola]